VRRIPWQAVAAGVMLVVLGVVAALQYRWLGDVSDAERERMRASLRSRTADFTQAFDGELTRTYMAFRVDGDQLAHNPAAAVADAYARWTASAPVPQLVRAVYVMRRESPETLQQFDLERHTFAPVGWPAELAPLRDSTRTIPQIPGVPMPIFVADAIDARVPALVIGVSRMRRLDRGGTVAVVPDPDDPGAGVIVAFDRERLERDLLDTLVAKYFGRAPESEYVISVVRRADGQAILPATGAPLDRSVADVTSGVFGLRLSDLEPVTNPAGRGETIAHDRFTIAIVRRGNVGGPARMLSASGDAQGAWEVRARYRAGSLESIVARSRQRNLAVSLGILGLLAASVVLAVVSAQRQQRLARQQMEFVAAVSHELRTPLAVIRSAGENLADGVVDDPTQVKRYGDVIQAEGRRLHDMVERVMAFAGMSSGAPMRLRNGVDIGQLVADAVAGASAAAADHRVTVTPVIASGVPPTAGDADALRSAFQNVIDNAVKYSPEGSTVEIGVERVAMPKPWNTGIRVRVVDRGVGIDPADVAHVFEPFFRGRRAIDAQVRGSGIGLTVVKRVVDAHNGEVTIDSSVGRGTTVTVTLRVTELHDVPSRQTTRRLKAEAARQETRA
jgi:signal transduction histidine kinase